MGTMICKVFCDDPTRKRLKAVFVYCGSSQSSKHSSKAVHRFGLWSPPGKPGTALPLPFDSLRSLRTTPRFSGGIPSESLPAMAGARVEGSNTTTQLGLFNGLAHYRRRDGEVNHNRQQVLNNGSEWPAAKRRIDSHTVQHPRERQRDEACGGARGKDR